MDELKPCPFCGSVEFEYGSSRRFMFVRCLECDCCGPRTMAGTRENGLDLMASTWNTRAKEE